MYIFLKDFTKFKVGDVVKLPRALAGSLIIRGIIEPAKDETKNTGASNLENYLKGAQKSVKLPEASKKESGDSTVTTDKIDLKSFKKKIGIY